MAKKGNAMLQRARASESKAGSGLKTAGKSVIKTPDQSQGYSPYRKGK